MSNQTPEQQPTLGARAKGLIEVDGLQFKDLDGDGQLAPYEDWRLSAQERAADLVSRMTLDEKAGLMLIDTVNAAWGGELGSMDPVVSFAEVMGAEWHAIGLRGMYGYMVDLITEPRWYRTHECFSENADLTSDIITALLQTLQGPEVVDGSSLNPSTDVALTVKHFPGGGPQELGLDPHYSFGKTQVYPGGNFGHHLKPFRAAIDSGAASISPTTACR